MARRNKKRQDAHSAAPRPASRDCVWRSAAPWRALLARRRRYESGPRDQFWMDEIWSLVVFCPRVKSSLDVLTLHHDNNHYLITLWMYLLGPLEKNWIVYRVPSIVAGIGTVALAAQIAGAGETSRPSPRRYCVARRTC